MKNIIICSDGTGNRDIKGRGTNVFKLFEAIDLNGHRLDVSLDPQVALYDDGVGSDDFKPVKILGGVAGVGLSRNVRRLYRELARIYDAGDRIFLFGFSRGAFTVRTLAGLIGTCGIIDGQRAKTAAELRKLVRRAYRLYRKKYRTSLQSLVLGSPSPDITQFTDEWCQAGCRPGTVRIHFIGVWDTVDAVGTPFHLSDFINLAIYRFKFPDYHLGRHVERACHALSIDDERAAFVPLVWSPRDAADTARIDQVWFTGVHSNVGGGYPKQGISLVALDWILRNAETAGLRIIERDRQFYQQHANVDDKLYDSRAGLGMFYRWKPRDIAQICRDNAVPPAVHLTVLERIAHGTDDYAPGNLALNARVVFTSTGDAAHDAAVSSRAQAVESVLRATADSIGESLLTRVRPSIVIGRISYYVYVATMAVAVIAASAPEGERATIWDFAKNAWTLVSNVMTIQVGALFETLKQLASSPYVVLLLVSGFVLSWALERLADNRMSGVFGEFWHDQQQRLRRALKSARQSQQAPPPGPRES